LIKVFRSKEEIAKMREHSMRLSDFHIGLEFWMSGSHWRCTDVGSRVVVAIKLEHDDDPGMYNGPPYKICEHTLDEYVHHICSLTRHGGNSGSFTDEEVERSRYSDRDDIEEYIRPPVLEPLESFEASRARWHAKRIEEATVREQQAAAEREALAALRAAHAEAEEDEGIDFTEMPQVTDFTGIKRLRDFGSLSELMSTLYREKLDRVAKAAAEQKDPPPYD
jgi:hypothetical protein